MTRILVIPGGPGFGSGYLRCLEALLPRRNLEFVDPVSDSLSGMHRELSEACRGLPAVLIGHSFGGLLAALHALRHPAEVAALLLIDPDPVTRAEWVRFRETVEARTRLEDSEWLASVRARESWSEDPALAGAYFRVALRPYFADPARAARLEFGFGPGALDRIHTQTRMIRRDLGDWDLGRGEPLPDVPFLSLHGVDGIFPPESREGWRRLAPSGRSEAYSRSGHFPFLEEPERFTADAEGFLDSVLGTGGVF